MNLCRNLHPQSGEQLTPRLNSKRVRVDKDGNVHESANRRVFYDFTLSPPKSVSIAALVGNDQRIIEAHDEAVTVAMRELQTYAATRVRKQNQYAHRVTGNVVGAVFRHDTSRDLDPHLHSHCILFNATRDSVEDRWKALEACEMVTAQKFVRNVYYHELVRSLQRFGYGIENNPRGDFEIAGVGKELIDRFSKRHREIDEKTRELLEREPDKAESKYQGHPGQHRAQGTGAEDQGCRHRQTAIHLEQTIIMAGTVSIAPAGQASLTGNSTEDDSRTGGRLGGAASVRAAVGRPRA